MKTFTRILSFVLLLALMVSAIVPVSAQDATDEAHKETLLRFADFFNNGDAAVLNEITSDDYIHNGPVGTLDASTVVLVNAALRGAMPDGMITPLVALADGGMAGVRWQFTGTMTGDLITPTGDVVPANNQPIYLEIHHLARFNDAGEITEIWEALDYLDFLTQAGAIPAMCECDAEMREMPDLTMWQVGETSAEAEDALRASIPDAVNRLFDEGDLTVLDTRFTEDFISHPDEGDRDDFKGAVTVFRNAIPDYDGTAAPVLVEGNYGMFLFNLAGTFENDLELTDLTVPPTGESVNQWAIILVRANEDGHIEEEWDVIDNLGFYTQLGIIPS